MKRKNETSEYWLLAHQLSLLRWYRAGKHADGTPNRFSGGFRAGHTIDRTDACPAKERSIVTPSETPAMRMLLNELHVDRAAISGRAVVLVAAAGHASSCENNDAFSSRGF